MHTRRILLDGAVTPVRLDEDGETLVAGDGRRVSAAEAHHLPPSEPSKILCVHLNYESRVSEFGAKLPPAPTYFQKPTSALNAHRGHVVRPKRCKYLNYEGEIVAVIGRPCRNVSPNEAGDYIAGYTIGNDYGLHDFRDTDAGSMLRVKGSDTLCPVGPGLATDWEFQGKRIRTLVNGEVRQDGNTSEMKWDMHYLVADLARNHTLFPGDLVFTGTPANSRPVEPGDIVSVEVEGLGILTNTIVDGPTPIRDDVGAQPSTSEEVESTAFGGDWEFRRHPASKEARMSPENETSNEQPRGELSLRTLAMPRDANPNGDIFGGWVLSQMDIAAGMMAGQRARGRVATVAIDGMVFKLPVYVGDILCVYTEIERIGTTSMTIHVEAWALRDRQGNRVKVTEGAFTFVAIDENRKPIPVPKE